MDYQEFNNLWFETLRQVRFPNLHHMLPSETIDIRSMDRSYSCYLRWPATPETKVFNVTAEISWVWDALISARFATTEEDMLMQIYGDFDNYENTEPPWLRIDMTLHASTSLEEPLPLPLLENWEHWVEKLSEELEPFLPEWNISDYDEALLAWRGSPEALVTFDTQGNTFLQQVSLKSWQGITLPRQWDHPDKRDPGPGEQLYQFATKIKQALGIWQNSLLELIESHEP